MTFGIVSKVTLKESIHVSSVYIYNSVILFQSCGSSKYRSFMNAIHYLFI